MKICTKCNVEKNLFEFSKKPNTKDGLAYKCKQCYKEYHYNNIDKIKETHKKNFQNFKNNFPEKYKDYYNKWNKNQKEYKKEWYLKYVSIEENKQRLNEYSQLYKKENRDKVNNYVKRKYKNDIQFKLKELIKSRINSALKEHFATKDKTSLIYLGCTVLIYKLYLEQLFLPEMNWKNHGEIWEIDHIIPLVSFDLTVEENQLKAFHYTNTRPLFKTTKIAKSFGYVDIIGNRNKGNKIL